MADEPRWYNNFASRDENTAYGKKDDKKADKKKDKEKDDDEDMDDDCSY